MVSWVAGIKAKDAIRLSKLIKRAGSVVGSEVVTLEEVAEDMMLAELLDSTPLTLCFIVSICALVFGLYWYLNVPFVMMI